MMDLLHADMQPGHHPDGTAYQQPAGPGQKSPDDRVGYKPDQPAKFEKSQGR